MKNKFIMSVFAFSVGYMFSGCATKEIKPESFHSKALAVHDYSKK